MTCLKALPILLLLATMPAQAGAESAATAPIVKVSGRVIAYDGTPIAGAGVTCAARGALLTADTLKSPTATTDDDGGFTVEATPPAKDDDPLYLHVAGKGMAAVNRRIVWQLDDAAAAANGDTTVYAEATALGNIVLTAGQQLFGRVRDADGAAIGGVRIVATDLLETGNAFRSGTRHDFFCCAVTQDSGIFHLPCTLPTAVVLEFSAEGYGREWLQPVAAGTPLEMTLRTCGWAQGRVLDSDGSSIEGATVRIDYELRSAGQTAKTAPDGGFRLPLDRPGRWRITATFATDEVSGTGHSEVLTGAKENLEIIVETTARAAKLDGIEVRAVTGADATPVTEFQAVALWEQYANRNVGYREYRLRNLLRRAEVAANGVANVDRPSNANVTTGVIRATAEGFAPATIANHEWQDPEEGKSPAPIVIELVPEATLAGVVRDADSGKPIAGAKVWAEIAPRPNEGGYNDPSPRRGVTTAADGAFLLAGLGEGDWQIFVEEAGHPQAPPQEVELAASEQRQGFDLTMPSGAIVKGRLTGMKAAVGAHVFLSQLPKQVFNDGNQFFNGGRRVQPPGDRSIPIASDGSFEFTGVPLDNHLLVVRLPSQPRHGGDLFLPIEPFRVRAAGIDRNFDCSEDRPGTVRGKIAFTHAGTPFDNLVVVASVVFNDQVRVFFSAYNQNYPGTRAFVARDGSYEIRVGPGQYQLAVVDLTTLVRLHAEDKPIEVGTGKTVERDIALALARVDLELRAAAGVDAIASVERIEVRFAPKEMKGQANAFGGNEQYDSRAGMWWGVGTTKKSIVLPEGIALLLCRNDVFNLRIDQQKWQNAPLGRAEFDITLDAGLKLECPIEVDAAPAIPGKDGQNKDAVNGQDADAPPRQLRKQG